jgi:hypothetical protein
VAQLAGYVSEHSAYHHGEASLQSTIVGLAQDFVGSNNLYLLHPSGQFGTRLQGGKDAASARSGRAVEGGGGCARAGDAALTRMHQQPHAR